MSKYIIYKTTNILNGKFYIGKHKVSEAYDYLYLGSGHQIVAAIKKYGKENFIRETLYEFDDEDECIKKEEEIVTKEIVANKNCYNIATGGNAGKSHSDKSKKLISTAVTKEWTNNETRREKTRLEAFEKHKNGIFGPLTITDEGRKRISKSTTACWENPEHRAKRSKAISDSLKGKKQSPNHLLSNIKAQNRTRYCQYCNQHHKLASYGRWHGDKCKFKNKESE